MAGPTFDSENFDATKLTPPPTGPGSKTPPDPMYGTQTPIGGSKVLPQGEKGAPPKPPLGPDPLAMPPMGGGPAGMPLGPGGGALGGGPGGGATSPQAPATQIIDPTTEQPLLMRGTRNLVSDINSLLRKSPEYGRSTKKLIDGLLNLGWNSEQIKKYILASNKSADEFFKTILDTIKKKGITEAIRKLNELISGLNTTTPELAIPPGVMPKTKKSTRGNVMGRFIVRNGIVEEVQSSASAILEDLVQAMRKTASVIREFEDTKLKLIGKIAIENSLNLGSAEGEIKGDLSALEDEEGGGEDSGDLKAQLDESIKEIEEAVDNLKKIVSKADAALVDTESPLTAEEFESLDDGAKKAKALLSKARAILAAVDEEKKKKKDKKDLNKAMDVAMGKKAARDTSDLKGKTKKKDDDLDDEEDFDDDLDEELEEDLDDDLDSKSSNKGDSKKKIFKGEKGVRVNEDSDDKAIEESSPLENLIKRVRAQLLRDIREKEAQLYPFKDISGKASKVDNINETTAKQQANTINKDMKGEMKRMKSSPTVNAAPHSYDSIPVKTVGNRTPAKKVSSIDQTALLNKARLAVELAAQQQLKGLIENPLKTALVRNLVEAGVNQDVADAVVHNAFVDAYESTQKAIIREAFDNFVHKDIDEFIKIAKFVRKFPGSMESTAEKLGQDILLNENDETEVKTASVAFRPSRVTDDQIKRYWNTVKYNRRGF